MLGDRALALGLVDSLTDLGGLVRQLGGDRMKTRRFAPRRRGLLSRLPRLAAETVLDLAEERQWRIDLR